MAIVNFKDWIAAGKPYDVGIKLLKSFSKDSTLLEMLEEGPDEYNCERLFDELKLLPVIEISFEVFSESVDRPETDFETHSELRKKKWDTLKFTPEIKIMRIRIGELTSCININKGKLEYLKTDKERFEHAKVITNAAKERAELFDRIDHFNEHGVLQEENVKLEITINSDVKLPDPAKTYKEYKNILTYITKARKRGLKEKLPKLLERRDELMQKLGIA